MSTTADTVAVPRWAIERLDQVLRGAILDRQTQLAAIALSDSLAEPIAWATLRPLIADLEAEDQGLLALARAQVDQLQAYATDRLGELGVNLRDPRRLFDAVCVLALVHQCAVNGHENGALDCDESAAIRGLVRALGSALGRLAPDEARA